LKLQVKNLSFAYYVTPVLKQVSFEMSSAEVVCLVGPNGSGKSTLIRCIDAILKPNRGGIFIDGEDTRRIPRRELAKRMGYVPQGAPQVFSTTVFDSVLMGRRPHAYWRSSDKDVDKVVEVLQLLGLEDLAFRDCNELSGGQLQRVIIARALAQEPDILLMDESTSALDISHQLEVMETLISLVRGRNIAAVMVMHDLNMASRYADRVLMLKEGAVFSEGTPAQIFTEENIASVYGVVASVRTDHDGMISIVPIRRVALPDFTEEEEAEVFGRE
jgi:iron complex transport system ATP-binding protein